MTQATPRHKRVLADFGLFYAAAIWGSTFFLVKDALSGIDPVILVAYRFLLAGALMLIFLLIKKRPVLSNLGPAFVLGFLIWALYISQTIGLKYTSASNSGFITGSFVLFIPVFLKLIFKTNPRLTDWLATALAVGGLWVLTGGMTDINRGDSLTLIAAMTYALHVLFADRYIKRGLDPYIISCQQFLIVGLMSLAAALIFDLDFGLRTESAGRAVLFLALFPTLSAFVIQMIAQRITGPVRLSLIFAFEPVFAAIFAWTLGGEEMIFSRALGGLLIFSALIVSSLQFAFKKRHPG